MLRRAQRQGLFRYACVVVGVLLCISFISLLPSTRATADAGVACEGNNLRVSWIGLNPPITVIVNGGVVVAAGAASGSTVVAGPGSWSVEVLQFGDLVGTYNARCPGGPEATRDPRRINNGSDAGLNVPYRLPDGGFDLWTYDPRNNVGRLLVSVPCEQQQAAARQSARQGLGQTRNVLLFEGRDSFGRTVQAFFVWPNQITVNGFFADGQPHTFSFPACVDARTIDLREPTSTATNTPTFTRTPIPPRLRIVSAACSLRGLATFVIRNDGGNMGTAVRVSTFINENPATPSANQVRLDADRETAVQVIVRHGDSVRLRVETDPPISASVECPRPTATNTLTPTQTLTPPRLRIVSATCSLRGLATFVIRNDGGNMGTAVRVSTFINENPATPSANQVRLDANRETAVQVIVRHGDSVRLNVHTDPVLVASVECPRPTATNTPTITPIPPRLSIVSASCDQLGRATFVIRNDGGDMLVPVRILRFRNNGLIGPDGSLRLNTNSQSSVSVTVLPGDTAGIGVESNPPIGASAECPRPTATFTPTFTPTPIPPRLSIVSASCDSRGLATFVIRNDGGSMPAPATLLHFRNHSLIDNRNRLRLDANGQASVRVQVLPGDIAGIGVETSPPIGASVECPAPTATFTPTPSTPVIRITASCDNNAVLTINVRNEGASMTGVGAWVVLRGGDNQGGERYTLAAGASLTATRQGIYGNLTVSASDGQGGVTTVSVVCQPPA